MGTGDPREHTAVTATVQGWLQKVVCSFACHSAILILLLGGLRSFGNFFLSGFRFFFSFVNPFLPGSVAGSDLPAQLSE